MECSVEGCENPSRARGWCNKHYIRWKHHDSTDTLRPTQNLSVEERFWYYTPKGASDECWEWRGGTRKGYGMLKVGTAWLGAHVISYEIHHGPVPADLIVRHTCDTPLCVNPKHLLVGTHADNAADRVTRGRSSHVPQGYCAVNAAKTHCPQGHPYDAVQGDGRRLCRTCRREIEARYRAKRKKP